MQNLRSWKLLLLVSLAVAPAGRAAEEHSCYKTMVALIKHAKHEDDYDQLYRDFFATESIEIELPAEQKKDAVIAALEKKIRQVEQFPLTDEKNTALKNHLRAHGLVLMDSDDPYVVLKNLSAKNRDWHLDKSPYTWGNPQMAEAESIVNDLQFIPAHNTLVGRTPGQTRLPLLSSVQLQKIGLKNGGANSHFPFNIETLQSADLVHFRVEAAFQGAFRPKVNLYGNYALILNHDYSQTNVMLSRYVMGKTDLIDCAKVNIPEIFDKIMQKLADVWMVRSDSGLELNSRYKHIIDNWWSFEQDGNLKTTRDAFFNSIESELSTVRNQLYLYDYLAQDFEKVFRNQVLFDLNLLRMKDVSAFHSVVREIPTFISQSYHLDNRFPLTDGFLKGVTKNLGFDDLLSIEGKIPVYVPSGKLTTVKITN